MPEKDIFFEPKEGEFEPAANWEPFCEQLQQVVINLRGRELTSDETMFLDLTAEISSQMAGRWIGQLYRDVNLPMIAPNLPALFTPIRQIREDIIDIEKKDPKDIVIAGPHPTAVQLAKNPELLINHLRYVKDKGHTIKENKDLHEPLSKYSYDVLSLIMTLSQIRWGLIIDEATAADLRVIINAYSIIK